MFIKNLVLVCNSNITGGIIVKKDDGSTEQVYTGKIKEIPFYFYNERVSEINISLNNLFIYIMEKTYE